MSKFRKYLTIDEFYSYFPKSDITTLSGDYSEDHDGTNFEVVLNTLIQSASSLVDKFLSVVDTGDPNIKHIVAKIVFYHLCLRCRAVDPEIDIMYQMTIKELKYYHDNEDISDEIEGKQSIAEYYEGISPIGGVSDDYLRTF